ncbi:MAG: RNA polymerase sigma factor [Acidimicrobiales bacterium]
MESLADPAIFARSFHAHYQAIYAYCARRVDLSDAGDLASEVSVRAFRGKERFGPKSGAVKAWLIGIAAHVVTDYLRSRSRLNRCVEEFASARQLVANEPSTDAIDDKQTLDKVISELRRLPDRDLEPLLMFAWDNLSYEEIATALGIAVGTVKSRINRARRRLRVAIAGC